MDDDHSRTRKKLYDRRDDSGSTGSGNNGPSGSFALGSRFPVCRLDSETSHSRASSPLSKRKVDMSTLLESPRDRAGPSPVRRETNPTSHILVVDDDREIRAFSAEALVGFGYRVDVTGDVAAAWNELHVNSYDLLITDNNMPNLSGVELVMKLRSARMTLPVILVSGELSAEELNRNAWLQLDATLVKPFSSGQLLETVSAVLLAAENTRSRAAALFPVPAQYVRPIMPASQWGINE
jgi:CheY-like chemotaxis protein